MYKWLFHEYVPSFNNTKTFYTNEMMCRIDPALQEDLLEKDGCREMDFTGKPMRGWIMIDDSGMRNIQELRYWIELALAYNKHAKSSKKK